VSETQDVKPAGFVALQLRQLRGFETQAAFAQRLGISRDSLANYETGRTVPSADKLDQFREALGLPDAYFQDAPLAQAAVFMGWAGKPELAPSPDEMAILRLLRVVPPEVVLRVALELLGSFSSGLTLADTKNGEQLREAVERVASMVKNRGKFDRSRPEKSGEDALSAARELARQVLNQDD
jgi:transcriptional regulator with XRE-family HTH domain